MKVHSILTTLVILVISFYVTGLITTRDQFGRAKVLAFSSSCPSACDVNSDGNFTVSDAQTFASCIFTGCASDVNRDGKTDSGDLSYCTANCQDIMIVPTTAPSAILSPTQTPSPTTYTQPTAIPITSTQNNTNSSITVSPTSIYPTLSIPTQSQTKNNSASPSLVKLRKDTIASDYSKYCDMNNDGNISTVDVDTINKCIFDGYGYCATTDINADTKVDAGDMSAAVLCSNNGQAMPNCKGADFNNDERITQDEVGKISNCIFSRCALIDPNYDGKTDAGDVSKCVILSQTRTKRPVFSCSICTDMNYCDNTSLVSLQDCIFNPNKPICQQKRTDGRNVWDINKDGVTDAGDISSYTLCRSCSGVCANITMQPTQSHIQKSFINIRTFINSIWQTVSSLLR